MDRRAQPFVYEGAPGGLRSLPTLAVVLGYPGLWMRDSASGIDWVKVVHGECGLTVNRPLPAAGTVIGRTRVTRIVDKGPEKGALVTTERTIYDEASGVLYATVRNVSFCRGDGGYSASGQPSDAPLTSPRETPSGDPQFSDDQPTRPDTALLYRLLADPNPLHADPDVAAEAGFERPILHGLATYGVACVSLLRALCDFDPRRLKSMDVRFSAPVFPGETIRTEMWRSGKDIWFTSRVLERDSIVLQHGRAVIE